MPTEPTERSSRPFVSVVVPVRNMADTIGDCLTALERQTYPRDRYEIIVVDNGSTDSTRRLVEARRVEVVECTGVRSPYPARNRGIAAARGEIIALTDGDCEPSPDWIERAVKSLDSLGADLVAGGVRFGFSEPATAAEMVDSIINLEVEDNVKDRGVAKTANLVFHRRVVGAIGPFPEDVRSGGDVQWTGRATRSGLTLRYVDGLVVAKPARRWRALLRKQHRIGTGQPMAWRGEAVPGRIVARRLLRQLAPPRISALRARIEARGTPEMHERILAIYFVYWTVMFAQTAGALRSLIGFAVGRSTSGRRPAGEDVGPAIDAGGRKGRRR